MEEDKATISRLERFKREPTVPMGIAGALGVLTWGAYSFRFRGKMSPSVFLMHMRIKAQSMVVGAVAFGITYSLLKQFVFEDQSHVEHISEDEHRHIDKVMRK